MHMIQLINYIVLIMSIIPWEELSRENVFKKYSRKIDKVIYKLPNGIENDFYIKSEGQAVCTLALTTDNKVITVRQYRPGPNKILDELPGGGIEENETAEQAAGRELLEETGYQGKVQFVTTCYDCAYSDMVRHCFVVTDCEKVTEQKLDETEFAEVILHDLDEFKKILRSGQLTDVEVGFLGLDYLQLL